MEVEIMILDIVAATLLMVGSMFVTMYWFKKEKEDKRNGEYLYVRLSSVGSMLCICTVVILCMFIFKIIFG